ncbi:MAG: hypothetical protein AB1781_07460 [Pseudomonadota bacterium]
MNYSIETFLRNNRKVTDTVLFILSSVSAYFTYEGAVMVLDSSSTQGGFSVSAAVFSLGVSSMIFVFWRYVMGIVPTMRTARNRWLGMGIIGLGGMFILCLSCWMNVMALAGAGALTAHMRDSIKDYETALQTAYQQAKGIESLAADLDIAAVRYGNLADREARQGTLTGVAGAGGVADSLQTSRKALSDLSAMIKSRNGQVEGLYTQGQAAITAMASLVTTEGAIAERYTAFAAEAAKVAKIVGTLNGGELASVVSRSVRSLSGGTGLFNSMSNNKSVATAQGDALQRLASDLSGTGDRIAATAAELGKAASTEPLAFERLAPSKAVVLYADELLPYWAGGVGLDLMPVVLVLLLMLLYHAEAEPPPTDPDVDGMSFGQVRKVLLALEQTKAGQTSMANTKPPALQADGPAPAPLAAKLPDPPGLSAFDEDEWSRHLNGAR